MSNLIRAWTKNILEQQKFVAANAFAYKPLITHAVSKNMEGKYTQDLVQTQCDEPEKSTHLHFPGSFDCPSLSSHDCDSELSRKIVRGHLKAGYQATFGHSQAQKDLWLERGFFFGNFDVVRDGRKVVDGTLDGMCNVGIVRKPLEPEVEECHRPGRWYGRVQAAVHVSKETEGILVGVMGFDVKYNRTSSYLETEFVATLEGMLILPCEKSAH